jgi:hypothetical protein
MESENTSRPKTNISTTKIDNDETDEQLDEKKHRKPINLLKIASKATAKTNVGRLATSKAGENMSSKNEGLQ